MMRICSITGKTFGFVLLTCFLCLTMKSSGGEAIAADPSPQSLMSCDIQRSACTKEFQGTGVTLDILPKPVMVMKDLTFRVTLSGGKKLSASHIDLGMPGMNMGPNRVELSSVQENVYEGHGVIVRCASGRKTWKATVALPEVGKVEFVFDVIY